MSQVTTPFVSVLTPTYNRKKFIPALVENYKAQTYKKERMEWIVLDDGPESIEEIFKELTKGLPNIRYIRSDERMTIGAKRNRLNEEAKGDIIVCMDDDDYYPPERVAYAVHMLRSKPAIQLAGSSILYMYYTDSKHIIKLGPYGPNHGTNGTFAYRSAYGKSHKYDETVTHAEEVSFLEEYKHPMIQLDPKKVMLVMSHSENTFNKSEFREQALDKQNANPRIQLTSMKLNQWISNKKLRDFYATA